MVNHLIQKACDELEDLELYVSKLEQALHSHPGNPKRWELNENNFSSMSRDRAESHTQIYTALVSSKQSDYELTRGTIRQHLRDPESNLNESEVDWLCYIDPSYSELEDRIGDLEMCLRTYHDMSLFDEEHVLEPSASKLSATNQSQPG
jgi:hypothetical protein